METFRGFLTERLERVGGRWALVSKLSGRVLAYYDGDGRPSNDWVKDQERRVNYFKNRGN